MKKEAVVVEEEATEIEGIVDLVTFSKTKTKKIKAKITGDAVKTADVVDEVLVIIDRIAVIISMIVMITNRMVVIITRMAVIIDKIAVIIDKIAVIIDKMAVMITDVKDKTIDEWVVEVSDKIEETETGMMTIKVKNHKTFA